MIKAVIFDMDGVISDTQKFHAEAESKILATYKIILSPQEITHQYAGVSDDEMFQKIFQKYHMDVKNIKSIIFHKWEVMTKIAQNHIQPIPHVIKLITTLKEKNILLAVASSSTLSFIKYVLYSLKLNTKFKVVASAQEVLHGKPAPDVFLLASNRLKILPEECIVIEDSRSGMIAAKKAHMKCIGLVTNLKKDYPADILITSLNQIKLNKWFIKLTP